MLDPLPDRIDVPRSNTHELTRIVTTHFRLRGIPCAARL
jgi:hypothetical protein